MKRRVAEIIHIVEEKRDVFLDKMIHLDEDSQKILWMHGIRNQLFFEQGDSLLYVFEYDGDDFKADMEALMVVHKNNGTLVEYRLKDVPADKRDSMNWWAPLKRMGQNLIECPFADDEDEEAMADHYRNMADETILGGSDYGYDDDDWSESIHI